MDVPETRYAKSGGLSIAYQVLGNGPLDIVFVPGFVSHVELNWEVPVLRDGFQYLASFARLIRFDKRGTGLSDRTSTLPTLEERMDDVRAVMDAAGSERAAIIGISEGGPMALLFSATYPERTSALVLWATFARGLRGPDYPIGVDAETLSGTNAWIDDAWGKGRVIQAVAFQDAPRDDATQQVFARVERNAATPAMARAALEFGAACDVRHVLPAISAPTLVVHRTGDPLVPVGHGRYLAENIAGARLVELAGDFHLSYVGRDGETMAEIEEFLTGARTDHTEVDRVLKTVLFTDIVESTARTAIEGDRRWHELLDRHDAAVRRELERFRGVEIKTTGDGFLAAFDGPARAIRAARSITDQARRLGLEVRAGLHSGECEVRGDDLVGMTVNIGARVAAVAGPGEVLVTSTVRDLVLGSGFEFTDRGRRDLKGVPGEWQVLAVGQ